MKINLMKIKQYLLFTTMLVLSFPVSALSRTDLNSGFSIWPIGQKDCLRKFGPVYREYKEIARIQMEPQIFERRFNRDCRHHIANENRRQKEEKQIEKRIALQGHWRTQEFNDDFADQTYLNFSVDSKNKQGYCNAIPGIRVRGRNRLIYICNGRGMALAVDFCGLQFESGAPLKLKWRIDGKPATETVFHQAEDQKTLFMAVDHLKQQLADILSGEELVIGVPTTGGMQVSKYDIRGLKSHTDKHSQCK